jgi:putative flippase GtrA
MGSSLAVTLAAMFLLVDVIGLNYLLASVAVSGAMAFVNFAVHDRFTFRGPQPT